MAICSRVMPVWDFENRCSQWTGPSILVSVLSLSGNEDPQEDTVYKNWTEIVKLEYGC